MTPRRFLAAALLPALLLAGCAELLPVDPVPVPPERPEAPRASVEPQARPGPTEPDDLSRDLAAYYRRVEDGLVAQGLLRTDGGGPDTPFGQRQLVENFIRIALYEEYASIGGRLVAQETSTRLHRWEQPVRMQLEFGRSISADKRLRDRKAITEYAQRLSRITGLPIHQVSSGANFNVFVVNESERRVLAQRLARSVPGLTAQAIDTVINLPKSSYCLVFALDDDTTGAYTRAVAIIRGEHPELLTLSCIHEELAQGLGLSNDSPAARPSIFNDDEEFGLLTTMDEYLLKMLYDRRMHAGMTEPEARAAAEVIAAEYLGGEG